MSVEQIERTSLWQKTLASPEKDDNKNERDLLRTALLSFRKNTEQLVSRIAAVLPGLTRHEISHLDGLWETASLIAGENYPLTPLEGFVFGGSVLLHDSALCFEAYEGGVEGLRGTTIWKDAHVAEADKNSHASEEELKAAADFATLRQLHADQSFKLAEKSWKDPDTGQDIYLIENYQLRKHLGQLIGQIASSHHWDIEKVASILRNQVNALSDFPREWRIDPVKIACLLRCADAAHIDNSRAPDFLHALLQRRGISFTHWQAQNRLARVDLDQLDRNKSTILFTSTRQFSETEADSWWVAYDATCLIEKEIRASNALLESREAGSSSPPFQIKRVKGTESPERMTEHIQVNGWTPCTAELHVGNMENLVRTLGGEQLYGSGIDKLEVTVRELIQNARDSIHARRVVEPDYVGCITVRIHKHEDSHWLSVEDDGVGMSKRTLTGPLLDFGTSFWTSSLVQHEFPGLRSSRFQPVGQFGIGFYSVFMIADEVHITSKRWDEGLDYANQIIFKNGISFRPLLKNGRCPELTSNTSTIVSLRLRQNVLEENFKVEVKRNLMGSKNLFVGISNYLSAIVAGLDTKVCYIGPDKVKEDIHAGKCFDEMDVQGWLKQISFAEYQENKEEIITHIQKCVPRMRPIIDDGRCYGIAAISTILNSRQNFLSMRAVGGLATSVHHRDGTNFIGYIDYSPKSARREGSERYASETAIKSWAEEQYSILIKTPLDPMERYATASSLCSFNIDPTQLAIVPVVINRHLLLLNFDQLANVAMQTKVAIFKTATMNHTEVHHNVDHLDGYALIRPFALGNFLSLEMSSNIPIRNNSIIDCLHRKIVAYGKNPEWQIINNIAQSHFGPMDAVVVSIAT